MSLLGYNNATERRNLFNQTDVTGTLATGAVRHTLLAGAELSRQRTDNVRNTAYFDGSATFLPVVPEELRRFEARLRGKAPFCEVNRERLCALIERRGLYRALTHCLGAVAEQSRAAGLPLDGVDDVLMVGGSTLLPGVYSLFETRFGRERVRAWQPFEAVSNGAAAYSAGRVNQSDLIVHDYAFVTYDPKSHEPTYTMIVPTGTRFPTAPALWKRQLMPTCSLRAPETVFKLVVCEIGQNGGESSRLGWDAHGNVHALGGASRKDPAYVVKLNDTDPTLGFLDPPHQPHDRTPRLEIGFGVDAERWLVASVLDMKTGEQLLSAAPVVRLV